MPESRRIRVLHVVESYAAGTKTVVDSLIGNLDMAADQYVLYGERENDSVPNLQPDRRQLWRAVGRDVSPKHDITAARQLVDLIREVQPDVIHLHSTKAGAIGRFVARALGNARQVIYTPHGAALLRRDVGIVKRQVFGIAEWMLSKLGGTVVACSESERKALASYGVRAQVIENGVAVGEQSDERESAITTVMTVGRLSPQKDPATFNRIAMACASDPTLRFVWVGDGPLRSEITSPNIRLTGWLGAAELQRELRSADIFLSTSLWEGMPLAPLEAMGSGAVLLLRECAGNTDIISGGAAGRLFASELQAIKALEEMRHDTVEADRAKNRRLARERYSVERMASDYLALYRVTAANR